MINFLLGDTNEIRIRINNANKAIGALEFVWSTPHVVIDSKMELFLVIPINIAIWKGNMWSGNKTDLKLLCDFYHKAIRRTLGIRMKCAIEEHIKNEKICK